MKNSFSENLGVLATSFFCYMLGGKFRSYAETKLYLTQGKELYKSKKWELAWKKFVLAENIMPEDPEVQFYLASTYFNLGRYDYALSHIEKCDQNSKIEQRYFYEDLVFLKVQILGKLGKYDKCVQILEALLKGIEEEFSNVSAEKMTTIVRKKHRTAQYIAYKSLGNLFLKQKKYDKAVEAYNKAFEVEESPDIFYSLGVLNFAQEKYEEAAEAFTKAIEHGYFSEEIYFKKAYTNFKLKKHKEAKEDLKDLLTRFPNGSYRDAAKGFLNTVNYL